MAGAEPSFEFFISQRGEIAIISLVGPLVNSTLEQVNDCAVEIKDLDCSFLVLNFRDVNEIREVGIRPLAQIQQEARKKGTLLISGMNKDIKKFLTPHGLVRQHELVQNLNEAVRVFMGDRMKKVA